MQTNLADFIKDTPAGHDADAILRSCVHCGFCTATCPTYQLLGDERDGPRGRIYLIKQVLEGQAVSRATQAHLDRCLTCLSCQTTCPSGVQYGRLLDIGRHVVEQRVERPVTERLVRRLLRMVLPYPRRFAPLLGLGRAVKPLLPRALKRKVPPRHPAGAWPPPRHTRVMLVMDGCVQGAATPGVNTAAARVLDLLGISLVRVTGADCCGAVSHHLSAEEEALGFMRRTVDAFWPHIEAGAEAVITTASGCGAVVKHYGDLLKHDPAYADKAARLAGLSKDLGEILQAEDLARLTLKGRPNVAFHAPCSLQHGQSLGGVVEGVLSRLGCHLTRVPDAHLCCGSAGTYSILQPRLSRQLLTRKLDALESASPEVIATANIGCQLHLASQAQVPVRHWIELVDQHLE